MEKASAAPQNKEIQHHSTFMTLRKLVDDHKGEIDSNKRLPYTSEQIKKSLKSFLYSGSLNYFSVNELEALVKNSCTQLIRVGTQKLVSIRQEITREQKQTYQKDINTIIIALVRKISWAKALNYYNRKRISAPHKIYIPEDLGFVYNTEEKLTIDGSSSLIETTVIINGEYTLSGHLLPGTIQDKSRYFFQYFVFEKDLAEDTLTIKSKLPIRTKAVTQKENPKTELVQIILSKEDTNEIVFNLNSTILGKEKHIITFLLTNRIQFEAAKERKEEWMPQETLKKFTNWIKRKTV